MNLAERLHAVHGTAPGPVTAPRAVATAEAPAPAKTETTAPAAPSASAAKPPTPSRNASGHQPPVQDALGKMKERASAVLFERMGSRLLDSSLDEDKLHQMVQQELAKVVEEEEIPLSQQERQRLIREVGDDVLGYGPLQPLLEDPDISEIMVNGPDMVYVEHRGKLALSATRFQSEEQLRRVIERIVSRVGRRIDESSPLVDARLADGSRVNAVIPPLAVNGSSLTIRKFAADPFQVQDLIGFGTLSPEMATLLDACVRARLNIIVSGGTGTGKTTLLNVLSSFIPTGERIVTIEDAVELQLQQDHVVRLESRPANIEGKGAITIRDLVRNSLRMRPDRIVIGEVRGGETLDMLQAMNTGHDGSLSTVHSNSPRDAIARLETLVLMAGMDLPLRAIREQIASAVDVIVQLTRLRDGTRRVTHVTEVQGMEGEIVTLQDAFVFDYSAGVDATGRFLGKPVPTGVRPRFTDRFRELGIELPAQIFEPAGPARTKGATR
ncbi:CpaF family protein [Arthrobacter sulfonylureivorans]|uniref:CpaF family protein n=1 Tax=Arthrobacter sulfonylureivorans TaxID=2486855 RepID=UPI0039E6124A